MRFFKKSLPLAVCFTVGLITFCTYYVPHRASQHAAETLSQWENIVYAFAFVLGLMSLFASHYHKIKKRADGWGYSVFVYAGFLAVFVPSVFSRGKIMDQAGALTGLGWSYNYLVNALQGTMFSVLAFYIVSTVYKSFRIKSWQAFALFLAAFILIIGKVPLGQLVCGKFFLFDVNSPVEWIMSVPVVAARRGIMIGVAVGVIATSLKIMLGIERQYLGRD